MRLNMYLICNIGPLGGKITYCQSACMVVYKPTQEKERRREKLVRHNKIKTIQSPPEYSQKIFYPSPRCKALAVGFSLTIAPLCYAPISGGFPCMYTLFIGY